MTTLAEHIRKTVDAAPPLTSEQRDRLVLLLRGERLVPVLTFAQEDAAARRRREVEERQTRDAVRLARAVLACDVCDCPRFAHEDRGHEWVPGRIDKVVARLKRGRKP